MLTSRGVIVGEGTAMRLLIARGVPRQASHRVRSRPLVHTAASGCVY
jgi:hypothetical protein